VDREGNLIPGARLQSTGEGTTMAGTRLGRAKKASALLPLAVLSIAWTASLTTAGGG
jgi:hypothetical protein